MAIESCLALGVHQRLEHRARLELALLPGHGNDIPTGIDNQD